MQYQNAMLLLFFDNDLQMACWIFPAYFQKNVIVMKVEIIRKGKIRSEHYDRKNFILTLHKKMNVVIRWFNIKMGKGTLEISVAPHLDRRILQCHSHFRGPI